MLVSITVKFVATGELQMCIYYLVFYFFSKKFLGRRVNKTSHSQQQWLKWCMNRMASVAQRVNFVSANGFANLFCDHYRIWTLVFIISFILRIRIIVASTIFGGVSFIILGKSVQFRIQLIFHAIILLR